MGSHTSRLPPARAGELKTSLDALRRIVQALRTSSSRAHAHTGLGSAQLFVLQQLARAPLSINELGEQTHTHQSSVSVVVQRLELSGYVARRPAKADKRRVEVHLLPRGKALLRRSPAVVQDELFRALGELPAAVRKNLARGLTLLADGMGLTAAAPMFFEELPAPRAKKPAKPVGPG
jgi:DNA-binding MarR family transcriptional regulator